MGNLTYAVGKLGATADELSQGHGDIRGRLFRATMQNLIPIFPDDLPDNLRGEYEDILEAVSWLPPWGGPSGKVGATIHAMSDEEVQTVVERIFVLYSRASKALHGGNSGYPETSEEWARQAAADALARSPGQEEEESSRGNPKIIGLPPWPPGVNPKMAALEKAVGKTVTAVEYGPVEGLPEWVHEGEAIVLHFTDGTALSIEIGSNAKNLSKAHPGLKPRDIHTDLIPIWRDRPAPK